MTKRSWIVGLGLFCLFSLLLLTIPLSASNSTGNQQKPEDTAEATSDEAETLMPTITPTPMNLMVDVKTGILRDAPGIRSRRIGIVKHDTYLTVLGVANVDKQIWYWVQLNDDEQAWISGMIVHVVGNPELVPTIDLTDFFTETITPTRTPGGSTTTRLTPTVTQVLPTAWDNQPTATITRVPKTNLPPNNPPQTTSVASTNPPPPPTRTPNHSQPSPVPPTNVPPTNPPPPPPTSVPPTNPPPPTDVPPTNPPPPQPTSPPPPAPTSVPPPTTAPGN